MRGSGSHGCEFCNRHGSQISKARDLLSEVPAQGISGQKGREDGTAFEILHSSVFYETNKSAPQGGGREKGGEP